MTETNEKNHYFVTFERYQLFLAFCSANNLKSDQITVIRQPGSYQRIPPESTIYVLEKPALDTQVELDCARLWGKCVLKHVNPFDKTVNEDRRHA